MRVVRALSWGHVEPYRASWYGTVNAIVLTLSPAGVPVPFAVRRAR